MLDSRKAIAHWKAKGLDFSSILYKPAGAAAHQNVLQRAAGSWARAIAGRDARCWICAGRRSEHQTPVVVDLPIRNINRTVGHDFVERSHAAIRWPRIRQRRHDSTELQRLGRPKLVGVWRARGYGARGRRCERLLRQRTFGRARSSFIRRAKRRSPAEKNIVAGNVVLVWRHQRRAVICAASPASGSAFATAARMPWWKASAIMVANT